MSELNPRPPQKLHEWAFTWQGEPRKRQPWVMVCVWVPVAVARETGWMDGNYSAADRIGPVADYLQKHLGWAVARTIGWGHGSGTDDGLDCVSVTVLKSTLKDISAHIQ
jgi:hypothetical protein